MRTIKKGQHITFAEGEYSDYCVEALVVSIVEFDLDELKSEWESEHTSDKETPNLFKNRDERRVTGTAFLPWLVSKGLVEDVDYIEIHVGSYGESNIQVYCDD